MLLLLLSILGYSVVQAVNISLVRVNGNPEGSIIFLESSLLIAWSYQHELLEQPQSMVIVQDSFRVQISAEYELYDSGQVKDNNKNTIQIPLDQLSPVLKYQGSRSLCPIVVKISIWGETFHAEKTSQFMLLKKSFSEVIQNAQWIQDSSAAADVSSTLLRKDFVIPGNLVVTRAALIFSGLGLAEIELNNKLISDAVLEPQWTNYKKSVILTTIPVDPGNFVQGSNTLLAYLGNGMYNIPANSGRYQKLSDSYGTRKLVLTLMILFSDNSEVSVVSDGSWSFFGNSPIIFNTIYGGETFDNRLAAKIADENAWSPVVICEGPSGLLYPRKAPPVKVLEKFSPVSIKNPTSGVYIYDFGRNMAGRPVIQLQFPAGTKPGTEIKFTPGELLNANGVVTQYSSGSPMYFSYITGNNNNSVIWYPRFSYYGFRWIQLEGATPGAFSSDDVGVVVTQMFAERIGSTATVAGNFNSDNSLYNSIHKMILFALQSNLQSIFTDCPHREKLGWLEEDWLMGPASLYNYDLSTFYPKIVNDMIDSQLPNGFVPDIAPEYTIFSGGFRDSPEWGSSLILVPVLQYVQYQDPSLLHQIYDPTNSPGRNYLEYLIGKRQNNGILTYGLGDWNDIGQTLNGAQATPIGITATITLYLDLIAASNSLNLLKMDSSRYSSFTKQIGQAFLNNFLKQNSQKWYFGSNSQTSNAMPLYFSTLIPNSTVFDQAFGSLVADISSTFQNRSSCGEVGFPFEICVLAQNQKNDLIETVLANGNEWGYKFMLESGATTLTEAWNANPSESHNHHMLGHIDAWFYSVLGGINTGNWEISSFTSKAAPLSFCNWWSFGSQTPEILTFVNPKIFDTETISHVQSWHWKQHTGNTTVEWTKFPDSNGYSISVSIDPPGHLRSLLCLPFLDSPLGGIFRSEIFGRSWIGTYKSENCDLYLLASGFHHLEINL